MSQEQREQSIKLISAGAGRAAAAEQIGVSLRALCTEIVADPVFREAIDTAEEARINDCEMVIYEQAVSGSLAAAVAFVKLKRDQRTEQSRLKNETKVADAYAGSAVGGQAVLSNLSDGDYWRFRGLLATLSRGSQLSPAEAAEFAGLFGKSLAGSGPIPAEPGPLKIELSELEDLFGVNSEGE